MAGTYYQIDVSHPGLNKFRRIRHSDKWVVEEMARKQRAIWEEQWSKKVAANNWRNARESAAMAREAKKESAADRTEEAQEILREVDDILKDALKPISIFNWESLLKRDKFNEAEPTLAPPKPRPSKPDPLGSQFQPKFGLLDHFMKSRKEQKIEAARQTYANALSEWQTLISAIERENFTTKENHENALIEWKRRKNGFFEQQSNFNNRIDEHKKAYENKELDAISELADQTLSILGVPDCFPNEWEIEYNPINNILMVEYYLPNPQSMPTLKEVKYIQTKDDFKESYLSEAQAKKDYDSAIYKTAFAIIHTLFKSDYADCFKAINFNGWVKSIDAATGKETTACVASIQVSKEDFFKINLALVDPKTCFKSLKGVSCSALHSLTPVAPILQINREDSRFINSYAVADSLNDTTNLASMDWEDFEHLIRELFEKEFSQPGSEVRVTQASRDGGVDAIVFDPDPIRGGKIVIQAKRYTNTVGVSAVRDLYGTLVNEGATKGVLVTTSDYGPDSYEFAKGKPISLLNGANLLHLLAKHGHQAKIDISEAKLFNIEQAKAGK